MPLDGRLAARVRRAAEQHRAWLQERDELIGQAHAAGGSSREIAVLTGLSHVGVQKVLRRSQQPSTPQ